MTRFKVILLLVIVSVIYFFYNRIETQPIGYSAMIIGVNEYDLEIYAVEENIPNTDIYSYQLEREFEDIEDVIDYLKEHSTDKSSDFRLRKYDLGNFRDDSGHVDWDLVSDAIVIEYRYWNKIYSIEYRASFRESNKNKVSISDDGYVLDYRSAGK